MSKLKIAIQKSGRLNQDSLKLLKDCGIKIDNGKDQLKVAARNFPIEVLYLRNSDIPQYIEDGVVDIAVIGENILIEKEKKFEIVERLGFAKCRVSLAVPKKRKPMTLLFLMEKIATSYPNTLNTYLKKNNIEADIHVISGSVEIAPNIGLADGVCDIVSSGSTLFKNGLRETQVILKSEAVLAKNVNLDTEKKAILDKLVFRIQAVLRAKNTRYVLMNVPNDKIDAITAILPVLKSPTILPLAQEGWSSLHSVIDEDKFWNNIDALKNAGAEGILVVPIDKNGIVMKVYKYPNTDQWEALTKRPILEQETLDTIVLAILKDVKINKDKALLKYAEKFDKVTLKDLQVNTSEIQVATNQISQDLKDAIQLAKQNIEIFHTAQKEKEQIIETTKGVKCWRKSVGIDKVGLYIPGGSAPLFSTILMLGIPAKLAGCKEVVLCTPPNKEGNVHPAILYTANLVGITKIFKVGGAQAIAAMAYGTETISKVYKIFGPGNQYVTKAKELVQQEGVAIDMPAGPSEVLVIADQSSNPEFVAADLLSQAEHGPDSQVILLSDNEEIINKTKEELKKQLDLLPRKEIASEALKISRSILLDSIEECVAFSNLYAPEHLIFATENASNYIEKITNAGSVFLGKYSCESAGDYASGTNHTLPTNGYAKNYSGVSLDSFVKKITFQNLTKEGIHAIGPAIELMAEAEGLDAHKNAVTLRLKEIKNV